MLALGVSLLLTFVAPAEASGPALCTDVVAHFILPMGTTPEVASETDKIVWEALTARPQGDYTWSGDVSRCPSVWAPGSVPEGCEPAVLPVAQDARGATHRLVYLTDEQVRVGSQDCGPRVDGENPRQVLTCRGAGGGSFAADLNQFLDPYVMADGRGRCRDWAVFTSEHQLDDPYVMADGRGRCGARGTAPKDVDLELDKVIKGSLPAEAIDKVVRRRMGAIRHCYQRELTKKPDLDGTLKVRFAITPSGAVSSVTIQTTTLDSPTAEACIAGQFFQMEFPKPDGGGIVVVTYPFVFSPP